MEPIAMESLPDSLLWINDPVDWQLAADGTLTIEAGPETDWFADPAEDVTKDNAPAALFCTTDEYFTLRARVVVNFASTFDAGVLQMRVSETIWAKLCFEYSPQGRPMIVSVVTRGRSDDCNSVVVEGNEVFLRVARLGRTIAFHYSMDGYYWHMVRYFTLGSPAQLQLGFSSQSPTGSGCLAKFADIVYASRRLNDIRNGE